VRKIFFSSAANCSQQNDSLYACNALAISIGKNRGGKRNGEKKEVQVRQAEGREMQEAPEEVLIIPSNRGG